MRAYSGRRTASSLSPVTHLPAARRVLLGDAGPPHAPPASPYRDSGSSAGTVSEAPGASASGLAAVSATAVRQACVGPYGQHCGCVVYQPDGRYTITQHVTARLPSPPLESHAVQIAARCPHSGGAQSCGRCALTTAHFPRRVASPSRDDPADLESIRGAQVDLFASRKSSHCQLYFSLTEGPLGTDALAHSWPRALCKYAFPPVSLLAQTLCKVREDEEQVLLVPPFWPTRTWFPELILLATAPPWRIPLRKELLSQGLGTIGTRVQICGTSRCGSWMGRGRLEGSPTGGGRDHHSG